MKKQILFAAALLAGITQASAFVPLSEVDTLFVPIKSIAVTGNKSPELLGIIYSRENMYFNDPQAPRFLFFDREGKIALGIGGAVRGTLSYDFDGTIDHPADFITYDIPVPNDPARRQALRADAGNSSIFMRLVGKTERFGYYTAYIQTKFTGAKNDLHLKQAYLTLGPLTAGLTNSTFVDVDASVPTIDEQGPAGTMSKKQVLFRYNPRINNHWSAGIGVEIPAVTMTNSRDNEAISQRVPDIPAYIQYRWDGGRSHIRLSALLRTMSYRNLLTQENRFRNGWGVQLSGVARFLDGFRFYYQGTYGAGINTYVNDLSGQDLDLIYTEGGRMEAPHTLALQGGLSYSYRRFLASGSWSMVRLYDQSRLGTDAYRRAEYISVSAFYNIAGGLQAGLEYLYGRRTDMSDVSGHANRITALLQLSF